MCIVFRFGSFGVGCVFEIELEVTGEVCCGSCHYMAWGGVRSLLPFLKCIALQLLVKHLFDNFFIAGSLCVL